MEKTLRKTLAAGMALVLALALTLCFNTVAWAAGEGEATLTINGTVAGKTAEVYQLFSATASDNEGTTTYTYEVNSDFAGFFTGAAKYGCTGLSGKNLSAAAYQYVGKLSTDAAKVEFAKEALTWMVGQESLSPVKTVTTAADSTDIADLSYGYYLVFPVGASAVSESQIPVKSPAMLVPVLEGGATINLKSSYPTVEKEVGGKGYTDAQIGDVITFTLTSHVPDMTGYSSYSFKFKDTLSDGLTFGEVLDVTVGGTSATHSTATEGQTVTVSMGDTDNFVGYSDSVGEEIVVTYTAVLNDGALIGMDANTNSAVVEYSNDPRTETVATSTPSIVNTYTFDFTLFKYTGADTPLAGASFKLWKTNTGGTLTNQILLKAGTGANHYVVASSGGDGNAIVTPAGGKIVIEGLDAGTYWLEETDAPADYNQITDPIEVTFVPTYDDTSATLTSYAVNGDSTTHQVNIENKSGLTLPETGGIGALIFVAAGAVLIVVLRATRKKSKS